MSRPLYNMKSGVDGVRTAKPSDEGDIFALLMMLHAENGIFSLNTQKVIDGIRHATERQGGIIWCIEDGNRVVASLGMLITTDWYSNDEYLLERWNFVHPDYRKSDYARKLLEQAKWTSERFKHDGYIMPFQCGINSFERTEAKVRLYARHMPCIGAYFIYGQLPRQNEKMQEELLRIEQSNKQASRDRSKEVRPVVETILQVGQRGAEHGQ